jgi:transcriptional regulator with XRE-family HTH domain
MAEIDNQQKREYAKMLYLKGGLTQAEIAERSGLSRQTISTARKKEGWDILKAEMAMTDEEMIAQIRQQINEVKDEIDHRPAAERKYTPADLDGLRKLYKTLKELKGEATVADMVSFGEKFIAYCRPIDLDFTKRFTALYDAFIKDNLK